MIYSGMEKDNSMNYLLVVTFVILYSGVYMLTKGITMKNDKKKFQQTKHLTANTRLWVIGWLTCIPAVLLPHSLCRFTTANAPANRQCP